MHVRKRALGQVLAIAVLLSSIIAGGAYLARRDKETPVANQLAEQDEITLVQPLPTDLLPAEAIKETVTSDVPEANIVSVELEVEDGIYLYKVKMSDGDVRFYDAQTGDRVTKTETVENIEAQDGNLPANLATIISFDRARQIALEQKQNGIIEKIELEVEDSKTVYSIRFNDDTRIDIDAVTGTIIRSETVKDDEKTSQDPRRNKNADD